MKKTILLFALFAFAVVGTQAQTKACCASKDKAKAAATCSSADKAEAKASCTSADKALLEKAAAADATVEARTAEDGSTYYVRKVAGENGETSYVPVKYCTKAGKFINESPSEGCSGDKAEAKATSADGKTKACCAEGAKKGKACCAKKAEKSDEG